jgi:hypothetical protein
MYNVNILNNLFYLSNAVLYRSGLASDGVFYDYNLYMRDDTDNVFTYWNSDIISTSYNLSEARASVQWDGTWDNNSMQADPLFVAGTYQPAYNSPACGAASDHGDIGAVECEEPEPTPSVCAVSNTTRVMFSLLILAVAAGLFAALSAMGALNIGTIIVLFTGTLIFIIVLAQYIGLVC